MTWGQTGDFTAQVIPAARIQIPPPATSERYRSGCSMSDFPAAVKDNIVLVQRGGCTAAAVEGDQRPRQRRQGRHDHERGSDERSPRAPRRRDYVSQTYPGTIGSGVTYALGKELYDLAQAGTPATLHFKSDNNLNLRIDYDILAETPCGDPTRVLQVGAHIDGVTAGPGINDDGSGTAMNLTIAHQILKMGITAEVQDPLRLVLGRGAGPVRLDVRGQPAQLAADGADAGHARLRHDRVDQLAPVRLHRTATRASRAPQLLAAEQRKATWADIHIDYLKQQLEHRQRPTTRSTTAPTTPSGAARGVPATGLYTGAESIKTGRGDGTAAVNGYGGQSGIQADPCYHEWCDTVFNLERVRPERVQRRARARDPLVRRRGSTQSSSRCVPRCWSRRRDADAESRDAARAAGGAQAASSPSSSARRTASARLRTPSLRKIEDACCLTVLGESPRSSAIAGLVAPVAKAERTSRSRGETTPEGCRPPRSRPARRRGRAAGALRVARAAARALHRVGEPLARPPLADGARGTGRAQLRRGGALVVAHQQGPQRGLRSDQRAAHRGIADQRHVWSESPGGRQRVLELAGAAAVGDPRPAVKREHQPGAADIVRVGHQDAQPRTCRCALDAHPGRDDRPARRAGARSGRPPRDWARRACRRARACGA